MGMDYVRKTYGVPAKRGMRVKIRNGNKWGQLGSWGYGTIMSATHYIFVRPDHWPNRRFKYHPEDTDNLMYLDE